MTINTNLEFDGAAPNNARLQKVLNDIVAAIGTGGGSATNLPGIVVCPNAAPGAYTLANSGVVFQTSGGVEIFRIWGTDPDDVNDFNSGNFYAGKLAGESQPVDNVSAGFWNTGVGAYALQSVTEGAYNAAYGYDSLTAVTTGLRNVGTGALAGGGITTGAENMCLGASAGTEIITGSNNVAIGHSSGPLTDLSGTITIGSLCNVSVSNSCVIGASTVTDTYFGSESAASVVHCAGVVVTDAKDVVVGTSTGTKIATATGQKLGFWGAAPVAQQVFATGAGHTVDQLITLLQTLGLCKQS